MRHLALAQLLVTAVAVCVAPRTAAEHWAVIVAGSRGYENYRHQADACHAYHVVRRHGIPKENVILMMYDDVAAHAENPFPGQLFNRPAGGSADQPAVDVYNGCEPEYTGDAVTPAMFVNVLLGNASATGGRRVLESSKNDRVFVNFVDHGARGLVVFPLGEELSAKTLADTLEQMHRANKYKELVFYMEACESGSMFSTRFLKKINAFATTAANGLEPSWGTYCPPADVVNGKELGTCLGDLYSVNWMEDSDLTDLSTESLMEQFQRVKKATNKSHVHAFGAKRVPKEIVGNFQSNYDVGDASDASESGSKMTHSESSQLPVPGAVTASSSAVDAHDIDLVLAFYKYLRAPSGPARRTLADGVVDRIRARESDDALFETVQALYTARTHQTLVVQPRELEVFECHEQARRSFEVRCGRTAGRHSGDPDIGRGFTSYSLKYAGVLVDLCENGMSAAQIDALLKDACASPAPTPQMAAASKRSFAENTAVFDPELILLA